MPDRERYSPKKTKARPARDYPLNSHRVFLLCTHNPMPHMDSIIPTSVSEWYLVSKRTLGGSRMCWGLVDIGVSPRLMTFFSTHHSPITVKRNARVLTMGTVKLSSAQGNRELAK